MLSAAVGGDLGDDRDDLRRADVEADDQVLVVFHDSLFCMRMAIAVALVTRDVGGSRARPSAVSRSPACAAKPLR